MKLSAAQQRVVELMLDGWEMKVREGVWMQRGDEMERPHVKCNTFCALVSKQVISTNDSGFGFAHTYRLTAHYRTEVPNE